MNFICALQCQSNNYYSFSYVIGDDRTYNTVNYSSIAQCYSRREKTMHHEYGNIVFSSVNISHNEASKYSALYCEPNNNGTTGFGTSISYSSFANNTATDATQPYYCIYLNRVSTPADKYLIIHSNIIQNHC